MCGFLLFNFNVNNIDFVNFYIKNRGPDLTNIYKYKNYMFLHNLLHITGNVTKQPFVYTNNTNKPIVCMFNGEIYNYKDFESEFNKTYNSDGEILIDLYKKHGDNFVTRLDGEFAIILFDFSKDAFIISTDIFGIKPLWISIDNDKLGIVTYESALTRVGMKNIKRVRPNTTSIYTISTLEFIREHRVYNFDLTQYKTTYDDWFKAFINSIKKRVTNENYPIFVCLSSGYDSGAICAALNILNIKYHTYTICARENIDILKKRLTLNKKNVIKSHVINFDRNNYIKYYNILKNNCEPYVYYTENDKDMDGNIIIKDHYVYKDKGAVGLAKICEIASKNNVRIFLSGQGSDEILADYGYNGMDKGMGHSTFGGLFPENLNDILDVNPNNKCIWDSFYNKPQSSYIAKEECVSGTFGIEGRFPYLDKYVVQEFLWLTSELKNKHYKAPLDEFLRKYKYPYEKDKKIGFTANAMFNSKYKKKYVYFNQTNMD